MTVNNADNAGDGCFVDGDCPPNKGNPNKRGFCDKSIVIAGSCQATVCPRPNIGNHATTPGVYTYQPGNYSDNTMLYDKNGAAVSVSNGLVGRAIVYEYDRIQLFNDAGVCTTTSSDSMHGAADGAGIFKSSIYTRNLFDKDFYYSSNSERSNNNGGVGSLKFTHAGDVVDYKRTLSGTIRNCGGGIMSWGSWVSCEEASGTTFGGGTTTCWQTDPSGVLPPARTEVVDGDEPYESIVEVHNMINDAYPVFITTCDTTKGKV